MNVQSIVTNSIYLSLQDREHQSQINSGYEQFALTQVNSLLDEWRNDIPFSQQVTFNNVSNLQNSTFVSVANVNYVLQQNVSTPLIEVNLTQFMQIQGIIGLLGIPQWYYFDELAQTIQVYPLPSNPTYQFIIQGRIQQINLGLFDTIPANMPPFMVNAVQYEVAFRLCGSFGAEWNDYKEQTRQALITGLKNKRNIDLSTPVQLVFGRPNTSNVPPYPWFWAISGGLA